MRHNRNPGDYFERLISQEYAIIAELDRRRRERERQERDDAARRLPLYDADDTREPRTP